MPCHSYNTTLISPEQNPETTKTFHKNLQDTKSDEMYCRYIFLFEYGIEHTKDTKSTKLMLGSLFSKEKHIASSILLVN